MKKVILIVTAIVMVASGVAAVSAYEAHVVNVQAHVENAIKTSMPEGESTDFETVFPEEWHKAHVTVGLSDSAIDELGTAAGDLASVNITLYAEWKDATGVDLAAYHLINSDKYYPWLGEALWVGVGAVDRPSDLLGEPDVADDATELAAYIAANPGISVGDLAWVGEAPTDPDLAKSTGYTFTLPDANDLNSVLVGIGLDAPVFEDFYNSYTDPVPKQSWRNAPSFEILKTDTERYFPTGENVTSGFDAIMGIDLKFQVTDISRN